MPDDTPTHPTDAPPTATPVAPYASIDCGLHDELQLLVLRGRTVQVRVSDDGPDGARTLTDTLADVYSRHGAEWLRLGSGETIRLDRLVEVDGRPFADAD